ncbi:MAG: hypothetical protein EXS32_06525 [Opitutus sp.]|nr:hypothetical protein [Opitutus sp.]
MATAYYLSPAVRAHWEKLLDGPILWFGTTLECIADYLEKLEPPPGTVAAPGAPAAPATPAVAAKPAPAPTK